MRIGFSRSSVSTAVAKATVQSRTIIISDTKPEVASRFHLYTHYPRHIMSTFEADVRAMREYIREVDLPPAQQGSGRANTNAPIRGFINDGAIQVLKVNIYLRKREMTTNESGLQDSLPEQQKVKLHLHK